MQKSVFKFGGLALLLTLLLGACSSEDGSVDAAVDEVGDIVEGEAAVNADATNVGDDLVKPVVEIPEGPAPTELEITDLTVGDGQTVEAGNFLTMEYVGVLHADGSEFDASWGRAPFSFQIGAGMVIQGWDEGIIGMQVGGRRQLSIPAEQAYGNSSPTPAIPPGSALVFVVDLLEVN